jgi:hypothetical protein
MTATTQAATTLPANHRRLAGWITIAGNLTMLVGTAFLVIADADLDTALEDNAIGDFLTQAAANGSALTANLGFWILGVVILGIGGVLLSGLGDQDSPATAVARFSFTAGPAAAMVVYPAWLGIVLGLAPAHAAGENVDAVAMALGHATSTADWVFTIVVLGIGPFALAMAGRGSWVPRWLYRWGMIAIAFGAITATGLIFDIRTILAAPILPVGMGFLIAAGIVAIRGSNEGTKGGSTNE